MRRSAQPADEPRHPVKRSGVERQRRQGERPHRPLDDGERAQRTAKSIGARAGPEGAERQPQDECREHELEGVRGAAQDEREHPDPGDLVYERRHGGAEADGQEQPRRSPATLRWAGLGSRRRGHGRGRGRGGGRARDAEHHGRDQEIQAGRRQHRSRQARHAHQPESAQQAAHRGAQAVGEIEEGQRATGLSRGSADHGGAHQGEGGAEQERLRQEQGHREPPLDDRHPRGAAERGEPAIVCPAGGDDEDGVERQADETDEAFDRRVSHQRVLEPFRAAGDEQGATGHAGHEGDQHQNLRVGAVTNQQRYVAAPDGFIDQTGNAGEHERDDQRVVERAPGGGRTGRTDRAHGADMVPVPRAAAGSRGRGKSLG